MAEYIVEIPEGVTVKISNKEISVTGKLGELKRDFKMEGIKHEIKDSKLTINIENPRKKQKAYLGTVAAHVRNMIKGANEGYTYKMKIVYKHFPINVDVQGRRFVIKNFGGEKTPRYAKIMGDTKVDINNEFIDLTGINIEDVGQTAGNIEQATRIRKKDVRIFQDGIYIIHKPNKV